MTATSVYIGPAGWSYPDWKGAVYPARTPRGFDPLEYLSSYFNLIEINSTFYRAPTRSRCRDWSRRVSASRGFRFSLKVPREFTHALEPLPIRAVEAFKRVVEPIAEEDRLLCVLAQFPWSFRDTPTARDRIERIALGMAPLPVAVEVRHGGWVGGGLAALRSLGLSACAVDQPVIGDSLRFDDPVRGSAGAYFRLHGRNVREWFRPGTTRDSRYDYFYTRDELADISGRVKRAAQIGTPVSVVLNNHFRGQAVANAVELKAILVGAPVDAPADTIRRFPRLADVARTRRDSPPADGLFSGEKSAAE